MNLTLIFFSVCLVFLSSCSERVRINAAKSFTSIPTPPSVINITSIPSNLTESAVFSISSDGTAASYEAKILRASDDFVVSNWTAIANGGSVSGLSLTLGETYYAKIRAVNPIGRSTEITTETWLPATDLCLGSMTISSTYASGDGSTTYPFLICTQDQFEHFITDYANFDKNFKLLTDIDLQSVPFDGIGTSSDIFTGSFNGNNRIIRNMTINRLSGDYVGFFNEIEEAKVLNLTLENPSITALTSWDSGLVAGYSWNTEFENIKVINGSNDAEGEVGLLVGYSENSKFYKITASGNLTGEESLGGVVGVAYYSNFLNLDVTLAINAPVAYYAGGIIGINHQLVRIQNAHVTADIVADSYVGGIIGSNSGGVEVYRSSFDGPLKGTGESIGGIYGETYNDKSITASVSSSFEIKGNMDLGGAVGNAKRGIFSDLFLSGSITSVGPSPLNIGGVFGSADASYDNNIQNSLANVTITSDAEAVGGFIGNAYYNPMNTYSNPYTVANNAILAFITASDLNDNVSAYSGLTSPSFFNGTSYYSTSSTCQNDSGVCHTSEGTPLAETFDSSSSLPLSNWDFLKTWQNNPGSFPILRQVQTSTPSITSTCPTDALVGLAYFCGITTADTDPHEFHMILVDEKSTCRTWLYDDTNDQLGTPTTIGTCNYSYRVTDGTNASSSNLLQIKVHDDISVTHGRVLMWGRYSYSTSNGAATNYSLTITNNKSIPLTGFAANVISDGSFTKTGGTCGATIPASSSCTIDFTFQAAPGVLRYDRIDLSYSTASGGVTIQYPMRGQGTI